MLLRNCPNLYVCLCQCVCVCVCPLSAHTKLLKSSGQSVMLVINGHVIRDNRPSACVRVCPCACPCACVSALPIVRNKVTFELLPGVRGGHIHLLFIPGRLCFPSPPLIYLSSAHASSPSSPSLALSLHPPLHLSFHSIPISIPLPGGMGLRPRGCLPRRRIVYPPRVFV